MFKEGLELEESELFEAQEEAQPNASPDMTHASLQQADDTPETDSDDDGIHLDLDACDSPAAANTHRRTASIGQSIPNASNNDRYGTSHSSSVLGSLPRHFESLPRAGSTSRGSKSTNDLIPASLPAAMSMFSWHPTAGDLNQTSHLGTSAPIRIPHMMRSRGLVNDSIGSSAELRGDGQLNFTPPHLHTDPTADEEARDPVLSYQGGSPSKGNAYNDLLRTRNAILRSTGFIEGQQASKNLPLGEVLDVVKDSMLLKAGGVTQTASIGIGGGMKIKPTSSLSALLGTSN